MNSKDEQISKYLEELFNSIPRDFFNHMFVGFVSFGNLSVSFDWLYSFRDTPEFHSTIRNYHLLDGAVEMAFRCGYSVMFNTATWKVQVVNV